MAFYKNHQIISFYYTNRPLIITSNKKTQLSYYFYLVILYQVHKILMQAQPHEFS